MNATAPAHASTNATTIRPGHRQIEMAAVFCIGCHQPASLDENRHCNNCRNVPRETGKAGTATSGIFAGGPSERSATKSGLAWRWR
jgi:hypothetical protein